MKEIKMDWERYQEEIQEIKDKATEFALMEIARWLEGKDSLQSCLAYEKEKKNQYITRIAKALGRQAELGEKFNNEVLDAMFHP